MLTKEGRQMEKTISMIIEAYVSVMGVEKWNGLSGEEQRLVIVTIASDLSSAIDRI